MTHGMRPHRPSLTAAARLYSARKSTSSIQDETTFRRDKDHPRRNDLRPTRNEVFTGREGKPPPDFPELFSLGFNSDPHVKEKVRFSSKHVAGVLKTTFLAVRLAPYHPSSLVKTADSGLMAFSRFDWPQKINAPLSIVSEAVSCVICHLLLCGERVIAAGLILGCRRRLPGTGAPRSFHSVDPVRTNVL